MFAIEMKRKMRCHFLSIKTTAPSHTHSRMSEQKLLDRNFLKNYPIVTDINRNVLKGKYSVSK